MTRSQVVAILSRVSSLETSQALELLADSHESSGVFQDSCRAKLF